MVKGSSDVVAGSSRAMAGDVTGAMQAAKGAKQTLSGASKIKDGSSQMVEGAKGMADNATDGAVNTVSSEMTNVASSATANSYGNVNSSQQSYTGGSVTSPDTKGSKELVKSNDSSKSKPVNVSGSPQTVARRDASNPNSKPLGSNSTRQSSQSGVKSSGSKVDNVTPISSNSKLDTAKSVMNKGKQGYQQAQRFANSPTGKVARAAIDARKEGGHVKREIARTVNSAIPSSAGRVQQVTDDYYYNQDSPKPVNRPTGNSLEERSRQQRERSDARIRRTKRPS